jgi:multidrug efflux pump subunit AcrA (membrane-fusion protein)
MRRLAWGLAILAILATLAWFGSGVVGAALDSDANLPTFRAERGPFVHRVDAEGVLVATNATPIVTPPGSEGPMKVAWLAPDGSEVAAGEVVIRFDPTDMERELYDGESERDKTLSQVEQKSIQQSTTLDNLARDEELADLQLKHSREFQTTDAEIYSRNEIIESQIDATLATQRKEHASQARDLSARQGQVELDLLGLQQRQAQLTIAKAESGLRELEARAPHAGIFVLRRDRGEPPQVGSMTWPGQPIAEIPQLDEMKAQVYVLEADAGGVEAGIAAEVSLEAHPGELFAAVVQRVAAVAKRRTRWSPVQYFDIDLALSATDPSKMKPGQRVRATLLLQDLEDVIAVPREAIFRDEEGNPHVFRQVGGDYERVAVTVGPIALGRVVVEEGIAAGDIIALQDPTRTQVTPEANAPAAAPVGPTGGR